MIDEIERLTKQAMQEVFKTMLSLEVSVESSSDLAANGSSLATQNERGQIVGSVGFIGSAAGVVYLHSTISFAKVITSRMLGIPENEISEAELINDAIGELSNMVVGHVKSHLCDGGMPCTLTVPSIVRGDQISIECVSSATRRLIGFRSGDHRWLAEVMTKSRTMDGMKRSEMA